MVEFNEDGMLSLEFLATAAKLLRRWRQEEWATGAVLNLGSMTDEARRRWPALNFAQACRVVTEADWMDQHEPLKPLVLPRRLRGRSS